MLYLRKGLIRDSLRKKGLIFCGFFRKHNKGLTHDAWMNKTFYRWFFIKQVMWDMAFHTQKGLIKDILKNKRFEAKRFNGQMAWDDN